MIHYSSPSTLDINTLALHPRHPERAWVVVEQRKGEPQRFAYDPVARMFVVTEWRSLLHVRGFRGVYGWIGGTGIPPDPHFDVLLYTDSDPQPGAILDGAICGVFFRGDGDHKFLTVDDAWAGRMAKIDLSALPAEVIAELNNLYPRFDPTRGEGWFGADVAVAHLRDNHPGLDVGALLR
ncbi:MAG TPA: hypothetical protein VF428_02615 [Casimicrobiaceae bacterium]